MNSAIILAAGKGTRFEGERPKQLIELNGRPLLSYSLDAVEAMERIQLVVMVIDPVYKSLFEAIILSYQTRIVLCEGGNSRQESVYRGLKYLKEWIDENERHTVLIHDSARPFARGVFHRVLNKLEHCDAVVPVVQAKDTIYRIQNKRVVEIPNRDMLYQVQTPQGFSFSEIYACHHQANDNQQKVFSDDGSLYFAFKGKGPVIVDGDGMNFKITDKNDLHLAEYFLSQEMTES